jgi:hypothetical protein
MFSGKALSYRLVVHYGAPLVDVRFALNKLARDKWAYFNIASVAKNYVFSARNIFNILL